jgi:adenylate kinase family enzyme
MKLYIVGSVASGKTTLAKRLSETTNIHYTTLDEIVYEPDNSSAWGNRKRPVEERYRLFSLILQQENWIVEDVGRPFFSEGLKQADIIVLLEIPLQVRKRRIIFRWIKQRVGIEKALYIPSYAMLKCMLEWAKNYDSGKGELYDRIKPYQDKLIILHNRKEIDKFISEVRVKL